MSKRKSLLGLKRNIFPKLISVFIVSFVILYAISFIYFRNTLVINESQWQKQNEVYTQAIAASVGGLQEIKENPSESELEKVFQPLNVNKNILAFTLVDRNNTIVYAKNPTLIGTKMTDQATVKRLNNKNLNTSSFESKEYSAPVSDIIVPVYSNSAARQSLQITFSAKELASVRQQYYLAFSMVTLVVFLVASISLYYLARLIRKPLKEVMNGVNALGEGNLDYRIKLKTKDEIGLLGSAFNNMAGNLVESQARLLSSVLGLSQGMIMANSDETVFILNPVARHILGLPKYDEGTSIKLTEALEKMDSPELVDAFRKCIKGHKHIEMKSVHFNGSFFRFYFSPITVKDKVIGGVILMADETEERILQRSRDEMFSIASHELRTPLTSIRGNSSLLIDYYVGPKQDAEVKNMLGDIYTSAGKLIEIVNDFMDASSLELGKINFNNQPTDVVALVNEIVSVINKEAPKEHVKVKVIPPTEALHNALIDKKRFSQVLVNVLKNALNNTTKGSVTISFKPKGKTVEILVADTGKGMSPDAQKLLFHKFQQAGDSLLTRDTTKGTGLGLYISRLLMEGMGGDIWLVVSAENHGSVFGIRVNVESK